MVSFMARPISGDPQRLQFARAVFVDGTVQLKLKSAAGKRGEWAVVERGQIGGARLRGEQQSYDRLLAWLSTHLSGGQMAALAADGDRWSPGQAVNFVFGRIVR
jgi:hypothetical protein